MPTYSYICNDCNNQFEIFFSIRDYTENAKCIKCGSSKTNRDYNDLKTLSSSVKKSDSELKTLGDLANRNRDNLSEDQKADLYKKHNDYKEQESMKELPKGMSRMKKPPKTKWT